jgi:hypothetical protein
MRYCESAPMNVVPRIDRDDHSPAATDECTGNVIRRRNIHDLNALKLRDFLNRNGRTRYVVFP